MNSYAVFGHPIAHSRSPDIHHAFATQCGLSIDYQRILAPIDGFKTAIETFFAGGGRGANVTVPFKIEAFELAKQGQLTERGRLAGAVNTLWMHHGLLHGCNTDGVGLYNDLSHHHVNFKSSHILILGAGGATRGILQPLLQSGCSELCISNRTVEKAQALVETFQEITPSSVHVYAYPLEEIQDHPWDIIINATSSSLSGATLPIPTHCFSNHPFVYDMMYGANDTPFITQAKLQGVDRYADGLGMLVEQAAESFYLWHGVRPDTQSVKQILRTSLS